MNRQAIQNLDERDFVTSLIMSDKCCQVLVPYIRLAYFECDYTRVVVQWVMDYYNKFKSAPKKDVVSLFRVHVDELPDEALKDLVLAYLTKISENEYQINNEDYLLDKSRNFIDYRALKSYTEDLDACLKTKNMDKARQIQGEYKKVSVVETNEADLMSKADIEIIKEALVKSEEVLFTLPENMNKVFGNIHRNDFISILAPAKRGKSFFLQYLALQALHQQMNVVFVSMEMTREEVIQRLWKMQFGARSGLVKPGKYETGRFVDDVSEQGKYQYELITAEVTEKERPSAEELQNQLRAMNQYSGALRVIAYPAFGASVRDITDRVEELAREGFVADVVIIDYGDITKPIGGGTELRNQLDAIWKHLRGFSMAFHCCTITASQTNRGGMSASEVGAESIAEDFRKICHVTSMVSLEQTPKMRKNHLMRVRNIAIRNGEVGEPCVFAQCLGLGQFVFGNIIPADSYRMEEE